MDGHDRTDVIEGCRDFLKTMTILGILSENNAPNEEVGQLLQSHCFSRFGFMMRTATMPMMISQGCNQREEEQDSD